MIPESVHRGYDVMPSYLRDMAEYIRDALKCPRRALPRIEPEREVRVPVEHHNRLFVQIVGYWSARERR